MATTTNYSWTTPDDTDLVKDGAAAIRTLGSSADTTVKNLNPGTTAGDIDYYTSSTAKARIAIGTAGQVLAVNAGATAPEWIAAPGGGKLLQVVTASTTTATTIASATYADTTLTATITPTSASSTILVMVSQFSYQKRNQTSSNANIRLLRGATAIYGDVFYSSRITTSPSITQLEMGLYTNYIYRDSPATTSATTYKTQGKVSTTADSGLVIYQETSTPSTITLFEIGA